MSEPANDPRIEEVLQMIQEAQRQNQPVDLQGRDLRRINLSRETVQQYVGRYPQAMWEPTGGVNLQWAKLERIWLTEAHLEGAELWMAHLDAALLVGTHLEGANLYNAYLEGVVSRGAHLEEADLTGAHLEEADLGRAHLEGANLTRAHMERADLSGLTLRGAYFNGAYLDKTRFTRAELGRRVGKRGNEEVIVNDRPLIGDEAAGQWAAAQEAYLAIKQNFQSLGRYEDARWAYVKERQMERKSFFPSEAGDPWLAQVTSKRPGWLKALIRPLLWLRLLLRPRTPQGVHLDRPKWLRDLFWEGLALYGESIWRPFLWGAGIIAVWSLLFALVGVEGAQDGTDYLVFSLRSFATMAFNDLQPGNLAAKLLSAVEAMLGVSTLALVMYCLGRRMSGS